MAAGVVTRTERFDDWRWLLRLCVQPFLTLYVNLSGVFEPYTWDSPYRNVFPTFISDRQKSLIYAVEDIFGDACFHGFCLTHLKRNFEGKSGKKNGFTALLWEAAYANCKIDFNAAMSKMQDINKHACL